MTKIHQIITVEKLGLTYTDKLKSTQIQSISLKLQPNLLTLTQNLKFTFSEYFTELIQNIGII